MTLIISNYFLLKTELLIVNNMFDKTMKAAFASAISGLLWGLLGSFLTSRIVGPHAWMAAPGGPVIGLLIFYGSRWAYRRPVWVLALTAIASTFIAAGLFGLCLGLADLSRDLPNRIGWAVVLQSMNACLWGVIFIPMYWPLFLLSFGNHALVRYLDTSNGHPQAMNERTKSRFPLFGGLALLPPGLIKGLWWLLNHSPEVTSAANGYAGMFLVAFLYIGTACLSLAGIACGIIALLRRERFWFLGLVGMAGSVLVWNWLK